MFSSDLFTLSGLGALSLGAFVAGLVLIGLYIFFLMKCETADEKEQHFSCKHDSKSFAKIIRYPPEYFFRDPKANVDVEFPSICDPASVSLSVIIPAYNESKRMRMMLDESISFLEEKSKSNNFSYEIIVVDDGSRDNTSQIALDYSSRLSTGRFRVLTLVKNRGKGGAIRLGVLSSRGSLILFADADGATQFSDYSKLEDSVGKLGEDAIAIGSRAHLEAQALAERSFLRNCLMYGFKLFVWFVGVKGLKDTQCGFKLFTRGAAEKCFSNMHVERWAFDVELLYIAKKFDIKISEVAVNWQEMDGSKLIPVFSWIQMALDILRMRMYYMLGLWRTDFQIGKN